MIEILSYIIYLLPITFKGLFFLWYFHQFILVELKNLSSQISLPTPHFAFIDFEKEEEKRSYFNLWIKVNPVFFHTKRLYYFEVTQRVLTHKKFLHKRYRGSTKKYGRKRRKEGKNLLWNDIINLLTFLLKFDAIPNVTFLFRSICIHPHNLFLFSLFVSSVLYVSFSYPPHSLIFYKLLPMYWTCCPKSPFRWYKIFTLFKICDLVQPKVGWRKSGKW